MNLLIGCRQGATTDGAHSRMPRNGGVRVWLFRAARLVFVPAFALVASAAPAPDFAREVLPLFEAHCIKCHGSEKQKGGLRFDTREGAFATAESGEKVIVPGQASQSRLLQRVSSKNADERMPPKGDPLPPAQIDLLKRWIETGANWPGTVASTGSGARSGKIVTEEARQHWSFLPLAHPSLPAVKSPRLARTPVDSFILARLEAKELSLSPQADARTLVRRIYFDLIGLPPTPAELEAFIQSATHDPQSAIADLVERLLASPHYGERWARHWLDVVRYADSDGSESDADRPTAYHYRDFVIRAFNEDMPFDAFTRWQLAGDELEPDNPRAIAATGFIVAGTHAALPANLMEEERMRERFNELDDMITTTGSAMLGLTLACARCHDHKYDPIPARDYYRLQSAFNGGDRAQVPLAPLDEVRRYREANAKWMKEFDAAKKRVNDHLAPIRKSHEKAARHAKIDRLKASDEEKALLKSDPEGRAAKELAKKFAKELKLEDGHYRPFVTESERIEWDAREQAFKAAEARKPKVLPAAYGFADFGPTPRETFLLARGDFRSRTEPLELGFLTALTRGKAPSEYWAAARAASRRSDSTQQRHALAEWMTDTEHGAGALVARVMVNRVWQHHFGEGLVRTVNDFGARCDPPTHPELLEWLAHEFVRGGWKLKPLHRLIMNSATYLQRNDATIGPWNSQKGGPLLDVTTPTLQLSNSPTALDPDNRLLWRRRPQRVESEILRDSILSVSGALNPGMFGPAFKAPIASEAIQARNMKDPYPKDLKDAPSTHRRSIYMFHKRVVQQPLMQAFDGPDAQSSCGRRVTTTVAPQALALLNDRFIRARAEDLARRLARDAGDNPEAQVRLAWSLALSREPSAEEMRSSAEFIRSQFAQRSRRDSNEAAGEPRHEALSDFCQAIFALNEFIYVD